MNRGERYDAPGYMGRNYYAHNVSAISGCACMAEKDDLVRLWEKGNAKSLFGRMLEVCFLLRNEEQQIVVNPYALGKILGADYRVELSAAERQKIIDTYREQIMAGDPFYNENLSPDLHWKKK